MKTVFDPATAQAQRVLDEARADHALTVALDIAREIGGRTGLARLNQYRGEIAAVESLILEEQIEADGNTKRAERLLDDGKTSRKERRLKAERAKAVGKNPDLASKMASREMSEEQVDVIAAAASKTDGEAACDAELIDKVASVPPEQGRGYADDFVADRATANGVQTEHNRQRALRRASNYHNRNKGLATISIEGDSAAINDMWASIERRSDFLYQKDGGRDVPLSKHARTNDQRKFDAAHDLLTGADKTEPEAPADSQQETGTESKRYTPPRRSARPQIVIGLTVDHLLGKDPAAIATQIGLGLIPESVLAGYVNDADLVAAIYDRSGEPLWLARLNRYATVTQRLALILRDRGCVLCGAHHTRCDAHHTMPWNAPGKGRTDLDLLVLLCGSCHNDLHNDHRTIYQDTQQIWRTRPATPNELPPDRPTTTRNQLRQE